MPETPEQARSRLLKIGLSARDVDFLLLIDSGRGVGLDGRTGDGILAYYEAVAKERDPKTAFNW